MEQKSVIYVAGNPNAYPLEYYDENSETFQGVIPDLLEEFSQNSSYEILYYLPDGQDHREHLAENNQVDLLSGYIPGETAPYGMDYITLFHVSQEQGDVAYYLYFTSAAPENLKLDLKSFFASVSQEKVSGLLIDTSAHEIVYHNKTFLWVIGSLSLLIALLAAAIGLIIKNYRKKLKKAQQDVEADDLTGLGNMDYLRRYYGQFVNDKNRVLYQLLYFYIDTDGLRQVASHEEANDFLRFCAVILQEYTGDTDILARVSDHGFVLLKMTAGAENGNDWLDVLWERIEIYSQQWGKPFCANMGIGIYPLKATDRNLNEIILHGVQAASKAQQDGVNYMMCSEELLREFMQEKQLQQDFESAFVHHEFKLYIQFYVDVQTKKIVGGEALSRWNHPKKGVLMPGVFVPLMEQKRMISRLDYYCLEEVCAFLADLVRKGEDHFFISCNFSRETFAAADFVERVKEIMNQYTFPRELLIFEITESACGQNIQQIQRNVAALREYGTRVILDDFGDGFTSFYDLHRYAIDGLKLSKGLIDYMMTPNGNTILRSMIHVGHKLNMTILAEGVETEEQVEMLEQMDCDVIQGFHFFIPLPEWEALDILLGKKNTDPK